MLFFPNIAINIIFNIFNCTLIFIHLLNTDFLKMKSIKRVVTLSLVILWFTFIFTPAYIMPYHQATADREFFDEWLPAEVTSDGKIKADLK